MSKTVNKLESKFIYDVRKLYELYYRDEFNKKFSKFYIAAVNIFDRKYKNKLDDEINSYCCITNSSNASFDRFNYYRDFILKSKKYFNLLNMNFINYKFDNLIEIFKFYLEYENLILNKYFNCQENKNDLIKYNIRRLRKIDSYKIFIEESFNQNYKDIFFSKERMNFYLNREIEQNHWDKKSYEVIIMKKDLESIITDLNFYF